MSQSLAMQKVLAKQGFDWFNAHDVFDKIDEEIRELKAELPDNPISVSSDKVTAIVEEYGDLLFAVTNLGRKLEIDPDMALRKANHKFYTRSEAMIAQVGSIDTFRKLSMDEKENLWQQVKKQQ